MVEVDHDASEALILFPQEVTLTDKDWIVARVWKSLNPRRPRDLATPPP